MRVTLVCPFDPDPGTAGPGAHVGGVERVYAELAAGLHRRGHHVTLVCSTAGPSGSRSQDGVLTVRRHRRLEILRAPVAGLARAVPADAEVVQVPATYPFTTVPVLRRARRLGIPTVLDFHFEPAPGSWAGDAAAALYRPWASRAYSQADAVVVRSLGYGRTAPSLAHVPEPRWRIVPNGVDGERFRPARSAAGAGAGDYLLFVGRLVPYKGVAVLLEAMARQPPGLPLWVVGDGPLRSRLEALARRRRVGVRWLGPVSDERLPELYRRAALTVLPSINRQEAFGMVLLESMASGTPVVATDLPGVADVARLGGLVAPRGDADALGRRLRAALVPGALPRGEGLARRIRASHSWETIVRRFEDVHREVAGRGGAGREVRPAAHPRRHSIL